MAAAPVIPTVSAQKPSTASDPFVTQTTVSDASRASRLASIDIYRGMVMFLMLAEVMELFKLAEHYSAAWAQWLRFHTTHVAWVGCSLHDMIQPSFTFLVGVSLPFSIVSRRARGSTWFALCIHALWRSILLIVLGIVLRSLSKSSTNFTFDDTLTQIGLGYFFLFLIALLPRWVQITTLIAILVGYWGLFASYPLPAADFNFQSVGVPSDWPHLLSGFAAHWNKNMNPAWAFDIWFLNLFPREKPFEFHLGGYATLSFVPTLGTMILGLFAGSLLKAKLSQATRFFMLALVGGGLLAAGIALDEFGICPNVKRIWTPSFVLFSGGICFLWLSVLHLICDWWRFSWWAFPVIVIGANSIVAYVMSWTLEGPLKELLVRHLGTRVFVACGEVWEPVLLGASVLLLMWLILFWLYRQRIFVRI